MNTDFSARLLAKVKAAGKDAEPVKVGAFDEAAILKVFLMKTGKFGSLGAPIKGATLVSPFGASDAPILVQAIQLLAYLQAMNGSQSQKVVQALLYSFAAGSGFGHKWTNQFLKTLAAYKGDQMWDQASRLTRKPFIKQDDDFLFSVANLARMKAFLQGIGVIGPISADFAALTGRSTSLSFLAARIAGAMIAQLQGKSLLFAEKGGKYEQVYLLKPSKLTFLVLGALAAQHQVMIPAGKSDLVKRQFFGQPPVFSKQALTIRFGTDMIVFAESDMKLFAQWCTGALCDQNHLLEVVGSFDQEPVPP